MGKEQDSSACPVDHTSRTAWLDAAAKVTTDTQTSAVAPSMLGTAGQSCRSSAIDQTPSTSKMSTLPFPRVFRQPKSDALADDREVSSIPRTDLAPPPEGASPANNEQETGQSKSGNWIYPSEQMFFNAMKRKKYDPKTRDMQAIIPIHNAVNERAWMEIKRWESGRGSEKYVLLASTVLFLSSPRSQSPCRSWSRPYARSHSYLFY